jgi:hypothetical protein
LAGHAQAVRSAFPARLDRYAAHDDQAAELTQHDDYKSLPLESSWREFLLARLRVAQLVGFTDEVSDSQLMSIPNDLANASPGVPAVRLAAPAFDRLDQSLIRFGRTHHDQGGPALPLL